MSVALILLSQAKLLVMRKCANQKGETMAEEKFGQLPPSPPRRGKSNSSRTSHGKLSGSSGNRLSRRSHPFTEHDTNRT
jgi:hypothetical protein